MGYQKNAPKKDVSGFFWLKNDNKSLRSIEEKINVPGNSAGDLILDGWSMILSEDVGDLQG